MQGIDLEGNYRLTFEYKDKMIRLIVNQADQELACRKAALKNLSVFLNSEEQHLFKGRLQLHITDRQIRVEWKHKFLGTIPADAFKNALHHSK